MFGRRSKRRHVLIANRFVLRGLYWRPERSQWVAKIRDTWTGKVRLRSARATAEPDARNEIVKWLEAVAQADEGDGPRATFSEAFDEWLGLRKCRPVTVAQYRHVGAHLKAAFGARYVDQVQFSDVEAYEKDRRETRKNSERTIAIHLGVLRGFFRWALRRGYADTDPTTGIRLGSSRKDVGRALTIEEARRLLEKARANRRLFVAMALSLYTGLRMRNVFELTWRHVDLGAGRIEFEASEMKGRRAHAVPIHPALAEVLRQEVARQEVVDLQAPVLGGIHDCRSSFETAKVAAGIGGLRWHDLRHTYSTWVSRLGSAAVHQALLGHVPSSVTATYTHPEWSELVEAVGKLPRLLSGGRASARGGANW